MKKTSLLTLVSLLVLSACGGSDGPVIDNTTKPVEPKPEVTDQTGKGFTVHQIVEYDSTGNSNLVANGMNISHDNYKYMESPNEGENYNKIEINGRLMEIFPKEQRELYGVLDKESNIIGQMTGNNYVGEADSKKDDAHRLIVGQNAYSVYGEVTDNYTSKYAGNNQESAEACQKAGDCTSLRVRMFYQGQPTLDMPTTGTATYKGGAVLSVLTANRTSIGKSSFNVDFGKKSIDGKITNISENLKDVTLKTAKIQGNAFKNDQMEGKFYGPKAANVAGYFIDKDQNLHGVFGAEKVTK